MTVVAWVLSVVIGLSLGLLGGGGSILTVPVFTYVLGYEAKQAIAMSLPVVGTAAAAGALAAIWRGTLPLRPAALMAPATMAGAYVGARLASFLAGRVQLMLLALIMLVAAGAMWRRSRRTGPARLAPHAPHPALIVALGAAVGLLTGLVGIGGGFLIVPALVLAGGLPMHQATSVSLLVIALGATAGLVGYLGSVEVAWNVVAVFAGVASLGAIAGGALAGRVPAARLQKGFSALLVLIAIYMLVRP
jgi:uncharacterized membrane protein YfcA